MPLNENAINEILPFAPEGLPEAGDLMPMDEYADHTMRRRGHQPGIALRELQNREARQATHMAAGVAQFIANRYAPGVKDDGDLDQVEKGLLAAFKDLIDASKYELCEFYFFRSPVLRPGFQPAQGGLLENAAERYPEAWAYLQGQEGQQFCKTEAEWQALTTAPWATLSDGTTVGWNGIGGVPYFAPNLDIGALRLPDIRGMYAEAAGFDALGVGAVHGDGAREAEGEFTAHAHMENSSFISYTYGVFHQYAPEERHAFSYTGMQPATFPVRTRFQLGNVVPTSNKNQPRAWGALPCVYLGQPAA